MSYDENYDNRRQRGNVDDDDAIFEFLERRSRRREYEEFLDKYSGRDEEDEYIGSRESSAARRVLSEGRVTGGRAASGQPRSRSSSGSSRSSSGSRQSGRTAGAGSRSYSDSRTGRYTTGNNRRQYNENGERMDRSRGNMTLGDVIKRFLLAVALLAVAFGLGYYTLMDSLTSGINRVEVDTSAKVTAAEEVAHVEVRCNTSSVINVLLLGIDDNGESGSRSDTMMIASVDTKNGTVKLCSILRDNYVTIPGYDKNRINSAYAYGGAELALQTVEANFRLDIDDYVSVDMEAMRHIVDAIGGVKITITEAEAGQINRYSWSKNPPVSAGEMLLDGKQAVCYAQIRKIDSDFGRTNRQRVLIGAIVAKCKTLSIGELTGLIKTVSPYLTTNMSSSEIATMGLRVLPALTGEFGQMSIPADGTYTGKTIRGMDVIVSDLEENTRLLHEFLYGE